MFNFIIILLLIANSEGKLEMIINLASTRDNTSVLYSGVNEKLASDRDVSLFNITEDKLKRGIKIEMGKIPDEIFLKDPTPYNNLYETFNWKQISRDINVKKTKIYDVINQNIVLKTKNHINNTTDTVNAKIGLFETVETTFVSTWPEGGYPDKKIYYDVFIDIGAQRLYLRKKWKSTTKYFVSMYFGANKKGFIKIKPGKAVTTVLSAKKTIIILHIDYVTSISGSVVANYRHEYGKYHFWAPSINKIMKNMKMKNEIITSEVIEIKCYTDPELTIFDTETKQSSRIINNTPLIAIRKELKIIN